MYNAPGVRKLPTGGAAGVIAQTALGPCSWAAASETLDMRPGFFLWAECFSPWSQTDGMRRVSPRVDYMDRKILHDDLERAEASLQLVDVTAKSEVQVQRDAESIGLVIRRFTGVVLMLVIRLDFGMFADWKCSPQILRSSTPFPIVAVEVNLRSKVRCEMVGPNRDRSFHCRPVAIAP